MKEKETQYEPIYDSLSIGGDVYILFSRVDHPDYVPSMLTATCGACTARDDWHSLSTIRDFFSPSFFS
jgi:hypothetical protein